MQAEFNGPTARAERASGVIRAPRTEICLLSQGLSLTQADLSLLTALGGI
jgi:hypothetical protein